MSMPIEPVPPVVPPAGDPPPAAPPVEVDLDTPLEERTYTKAEIAAVRAEAAANRVKAREAQERYDKQFEGLEDKADFEYLLDMARKLNTDPHASVAELRALADRLGEGLAPAAPPPPVADRDKPLTLADFEKIELDREVARQGQLIKAEAAALSDDRFKFVDGNEEFARLLWIATNDKEASKAPNRLEAAAAKIKAHDEATGKAAVAAYIEQVRSGAEQFPPASAPAGGAPAGAPGAGSPKTFKEASASAMEKLMKAV